MANRAPRTFKHVEDAERLIEKEHTGTIVVIHDPSYTSASAPTDWLVGAERKAAESVRRANEARERNLRIAKERNSRHSRNDVPKNSPNNTGSASSPLANPNNTGYNNDWYVVLGREFEYESDAKKFQKEIYDNPRTYRFVTPITRKPR